MAVNRGDFQSTGGNLAITSDTLKRDVVDRLYEEEPDANPFLLMLRDATKGTAKSFKHEWSEFQEMALFTQVNNGSNYTAGDTSIVVDDGSIFDTTDLIANQRVNEVARITAIAGNTLTVTRSWGGTAAVAWNDNDYLSALGTAPAEGAESSTGRSKQEDWKFNYVQEFKDPFGETWIAQNSDVIVGTKGLARNRARRGRDHKKKMEMGLFFGERNTDTSGDERMSSLGGLREFISTNSYDFGGALTWEDIVLAAEDDFEYGSDTKTLFLGKKGTSAVTFVAKDNMRSARSDQTFGMKFKRIETQHGDYVLVRHRLFRGNQYATTGFVVDMKNVAFVPMQNLNTMLRKNLQANSATADKEEWYTAATFRRVLERTHGLWTSVE